MAPKKKDALKELEGEYVELWCADCAYKGLLNDVGKKDAMLFEAMFSEEKGPKQLWENLPSETWAVRLAAIESFGVAA